MRRFIATYRWELWLLLWAPLLSSIAPVAAQLLFSVFAGESEYPFFFYYSMPSVVAGLAEAGLLLAFYARVRRLERRFLTLVWGYSLVAAAVAVPVYLIGTALFFPVDDRVGSRLGLWLVAVNLAHIILVLPVLLWFARRASRFSLAHAFFLFLIVKSYTLTGILDLVIVLVPVGIGMAMNTAAYFGLGFLFAWLLGNFDSRETPFQKRTVGWLLAAYGVFVLTRLAEFAVSILGAETLTALALGLAGLVFMGTLASSILPFGLIYLVRVRQPAGV